MPSQGSAVHRRLTPAIALLLAGGAGCSSGAQGTARSVAPAAADSAAYVTRLGNDTLAVERFVRAGGHVEADVVLRSPRTTRTRYVLELSPAGELARMTATEIGARAADAAVRREVVTRVGDSLRVETAADGQTRTRVVAAAGDVLPFIDMVHWPYEIALMRQRAAGDRPVAQPLLTGSRVSEFGLAIVAPDSATITHPTRGTMRTRVDARGRILGLDAGATTRKLVLERRPWMELDAATERWMALDAAGRSVGALSGRADASVTIGGATLGVDYGTPIKRGREIWGALVPWGTLWRTGANEATHFSTDRALVFGAGSDTLVVPAGRYTLFSIPERDGGLLLINRQTGQNGQTYDQARDLGRVRLTARPLVSAVEVFTIAITEEAAAGGELRLQWDRTELVAPFSVQGR